MADPRPALPRMRRDELVRRDDGADTRHEPVNGEVVVMNPPMAPHGRLASEIGFALRSDQRWCELWQRAVAAWTVQDLIGSAGIPLRLAHPAYAPLEL